MNMLPVITGAGAALLLASRPAGRPGPGGTQPRIIAAAGPGRERRGGLGRPKGAGPAARRQP
jgi:hypothetical protein